MSSVVKIALYRPHKNQKLIVNSNARYKVVACGRRFGKTTLAINELLFNALLQTKGNYWYVAPTYRQAKNIAWRMLLDAYYKLPKELQTNKNESELWVEVASSRIELKGADNEDSLRGVPLHGIVIDEVASIKNWKLLWDEVLRPALTDFKGWGIFISTPKGFNHFYDLFLTEQFNTDYKSFQFTSYDNPFLDKDEIEKAKNELTSDAFAQEYMADFRKNTGLIYKDFDRAIHLYEGRTFPSEWRLYRAMDFGAVNPTVCLWIYADNYDTIYVDDEYYEGGRTTEFNANVIKHKTGTRSVITTYGDPSGNQQILDYATFEVFITPATKVYTQNEDWVVAGIKRVQLLFKLDGQTGRPRIFINKKCVNLIKELESYHWAETRTGDMIKDIPEKTQDHGPDALRYFTVSFGDGEKSFQFDAAPVINANSYTGY